MLCVDDPKYLSKALGHDPETEGGTGLTTLEQKKEMLKYCYKAWNGLVKYIFSQCSQKGHCVDFPLMGRFFNRTIVEDGVEENVFVFVPHLDFLASGKFQFPQNNQNISPLSKKVPKSVKTVKVSLGSIGQSCEYDRALVASILKDTVFKFVSYKKPYFDHFLYRFNKAAKARRCCWT